MEWHLRPLKAVIALDGHDLVPVVLWHRRHGYLLFNVRRLLPLQRLVEHKLLTQRANSVCLSILFETL